MHFHRTLFVLNVWAIAVLGGLYALVVRPHLTASQETALVGGTVVVLGLPLVGLWMHWWVNESVFGSEGRRPGPRRA